MRRQPVAARSSRTSPVLALPKNVRKRKRERSDSVRSLGFREGHKFNVRWLRAARRVLEPDGTMWVTGTHHIIFSLGFALLGLGFRIISDLIWLKPDPPLPTPCRPPSPTRTRWRSAFGYALEDDTVSVLAARGENPSYFPPTPWCSEQC